MICPNCNSENTTVYNTRQFPSYRWRWHKCLECGERFTTKEVVVKADQEAGEGKVWLVVAEEVDNG